MQKTALFLLLLLPVISASAQTADSLRQIDQLFTRWHNATPGGVVTISRGDKIIYNKAFGLADLEHEVPNTTETIFESGSVAKQFTAASALLLVSEGKLSLQDDVRKYIPELPKYPTVITIQQLLNHTSGLKDWGSVAGLAGWPRTTKAYTQELALQIMSKQQSTNFIPGNEYSYSNSNYNSLVTIVERVSGQSLAEFTRLRFFEPLGMTNTKWRNDFHEVVPHRAIAYSRSGKGYQQLMPFENVHGHGGLLTTTADLLKWNSLLETKKIGGEKVYQWRVQKGKLNNGQEITYASGLIVDQLNNYTQISHSGATAGYRAWLAYYPQKKLSVTILSNDGSFNPAAAGQQVAEVFLGKKEEVRKEPKEITLSESELKRFDGTYRSIRHFDVLTLTYKDGKIVSNDHALHASHRDTLYLDGLKWIATRPHTILRQNANDTLSYRKVALPDLSAKSLLSLAGEYHSEEADATYTIEIKNNEVLTQIKPFAPEKLTPSFLDGFYLDNSILYEFQRDKKGKVTGLVVSTSRAERVSFIKTK